MKLTHYQMSINNNQMVARDIYSYQVLQTYREMQNVVNAKKANMARETTVTETPKMETANKLFIIDKTVENINRFESRKTSQYKETYEISRKPFIKKNLMEDKGYTIDIII